MTPLDRIAAALRTNAAVHLSVDEADALAAIALEALGEQEVKCGSCDGRGNDYARQDTRGYNPVCENCEGTGTKRLPAVLQVVDDEELRERNMDDAPAWHSADEANAWCDGFNSALATIRNYSQEKE